MAKQEQVSARFDHVQVDLCPREGGLILSVGTISMWLPETTVREVVTKLQAGLRDASRAIAGNSPRLKIDGTN